MAGVVLEEFIEECKLHFNKKGIGNEEVPQFIPAFRRFIEHQDDWMINEYKQSNQASYARNVVYLDEDGSLGLYVLVWSPNQWTPIHDHGTWGVVGVLEGTFCERNFIRTDFQKGNIDTGIELIQGNTTLLKPGSITTFVPNPDHIHIAGNPNDSVVITVHLYGNIMAGYYTYDIETGSRQWQETEQNI